MVSIRTALDALKSQLQTYQLIPAGFIEQLCKEAAHVWRDRTLVPAMTVHLLILQLLGNVSLEGLRRVAKIKVTAQAINAARKRLPLKVLLGLVEHVGQIAGKSCVSTWKGLRVKLADGSSFLTEDTEELANRYGRAKNQRGNQPFLSGAQASGVAGPDQRDDLQGHRPAMAPGRACRTEPDVRLLAEGRPAAG
jgi:hypothetical protein